MTFTQAYELYGYPLKTYDADQNELFYVKAFESYRITDRQTYTYIQPLKLLRRLFTGRYIER